MNNRQNAANIARDLCAAIGAQVAAMIEGGCFPEEWDGHEVRALLAAEMGREFSDLMRRERARNGSRWRAFKRAAAEGMSERYHYNAAALAARGIPAPLRVLVTVSGGVGIVDHCPEGVTVEVRDFDNVNADGSPGAYEVGPSLYQEDVRLVPCEGDPDTRGDWRRADNARPEFDGPAPKEGGR